MRIDPILRRRELHIIFCVTMIAVMEVSVISPVLPAISSALQITSREANLLIVVFTLPGIFLSPLMGIAADRFGRKRVLVPSLLVFGFCGSACYFVNSFSLLLLLRLMQGAGSASIGSLNQTIIGDIFPGHDRLRAMGYNSSIVSIGTMIYPAIGGAVALLGWHYPFLVSSLAFPVAILALTDLETPDLINNRKFRDYLKNSFTLIKRRNVLSLYFGTMSAFILLYGILLAFYPFLMRQRFGASTFEIGLVISATSVGAIIAAVNLGRLSIFFSPKKLIITAFAIYALSFTIAYFTDSLPLFALPVFIHGLANGILIPNIQTQISIIAPMEIRGAFMSLNSSVLRMGQTAGPLISGIILAENGGPYVFLTGILFAFLTIAVLSWGVKDNVKLN
ncbi:MAG TPA: MFS transporter [Spirochaetota bacterium]|nr:MFS transporter [Spirochaetota bacterium]HPJ34403.1 MFS transporter [Spirochaetota bacterium]